MRRIKTYRIPHGSRALLLVLLAGLLASAQDLQATGVRPQLQARPPAPVQTAASPKTGPQQIIIPAGTQIPLAVSYRVDGHQARPGDRIDLTTIVPIALQNRIVIPAGSYVQGEITAIQHAGHFHRSASMRLRFDRILLPNGYEINLNAALEGAPDLQNASVHGEGDITTHGETGHNATEGAKEGAVLGAETGVVVGAAQRSVTGGLKSAGVGTVLGAGVGAGIGALTTVFGRGKDVELDPGTTLRMVIERPIPVPAAQLNFIGYTPPPPPQRAPQRQEERTTRPRIGFPWP